MLRKLVLVLTMLGGLVAGIVSPAGATTPASFTLTSGTLSISAPTAGVSLGTQVGFDGFEHDVGLARCSHGL